MVQEAWLLASVDYGAAQVRSGHLLLALLATDDLARLAREISKEFSTISVESLKTKLPEITASTGEAREASSLGSGSDAGATDDGEAITTGKQSP